MGEAQHTPTPWFADPDDREGYEWNIHIVQESNRDMRVCFMTNGPEAGPNSAFIVAAVNSHATLTAALEEARGALDRATIYIENIKAREGFYTMGSTQPTLDAHRAAIETVEAALRMVGK